ncbi:MAG: UDP-2,3-diacylglucosamine diphosphatase, partial [Candidatus Zixiibacteriota bacterium]
MAIYFFSDAHLGASDTQGEKEKLEKLFRFFDLVKTDAEKLFILGDLFDFWFEYKNAIPKQHLKVVFRLTQLAESGVEIHYLKGNHDFWLGDFLEKEAGIKIHSDSIETELQDKRLFILHGDGVAPSDWGYRILKRILRNRLNIWLYQKIPTDWGIPLAKFVAGRSRDYTSGRTNSFLKEYDQYAEKKLSEGYDAVIMGHVHQAEIKVMDGGLYINSGDFIHEFSYIKMTNGVFE